MGIRESLAGKPVVGVIVVVVLIALSVWITSRQGRTVGPIYYDLQTGELFAYNGEELPPISAPSGGEGVIAHVFACGSCDDKDARFIGYLEKYTDEGKAQVKRSAEAIAASTKDNPPPPQPLPQRAVSLFQQGQPPQWVDANDPVGMRIVSQVRQRCTDSAKFVRCSDF